MAETRRLREASSGAVADYKQVLQRVLDSRPSGMRQRLAEALGKNRSFISQISNPAYQVPIPARHVGVIFEICHFSPQERAAFLKGYGRAHPGRLTVAAEPRHERKITLTLPDLGSAEKNHQFEALIHEFMHRLALLLGERR